MRKIAIISCVAVASAFGCLCAGSIMQGFNTLTTKVTMSVDTQTNIVNSTLIPQVTANIELLEDENKLITDLINQEKDISMKNKEIIFELHRKNKLL